MRHALLIKSFLLLCVACLFAMVVHAQPVPVFTSGMEGYSSFRIPAVVSLADGTLLAFCEGRVANAGDFGNVDLVMKRSTDGGRTWGALQRVVDNDTLQAGNPAPVLDQFSKGGKKKLFLFYNTGNAPEHAVREGKGLREVWYITSTDGGQSWSTPVNITMQVHRPNQPQQNASYNFTNDWRSYANTPGHAMQFTRGRYKGRIYVAANHSAGPPQPRFEDYQSHGFYTDDGGRIFHLGASVLVQGSNEATAAPLAGNKLMLNARNQKGDVRARIVALSSDGGATWDTTYFDRHLIDPVNEGSLLTLRERRRRNILAFCNAADTTQRNHLTLRLSFDNGRTWPRVYPVDGSFKKEDFTAYSDLVKLARKRIGILYERDNYRQLVFRTVRWRR